MLKIWGRTTSVNVQAAMWAVGELGLEHERIDAGGLHGGLDTPEYAALNPNRLVPTLEDGDLVVWESAAIVRYLAARYGEDSFWPRDAVSRAPADMWAEWAKSSFGPPFLNKIFIPLIRVKDADRDMKALAAAQGKVAKLAAIAEDRLAETTWLAGADFTYADILFGSYLYRYFTLPFERSPTPHLESYYERLRARPAFEKHVMISYEGLRAR